MHSRKRFVVRVVALSALALAMPSADVLAQVSSPPWEASPDVYKVIGEAAQYRIIIATWKPGQIDNTHSHTAGAVVYLTDCKLRNHRSGSDPADLAFKAGQTRTTSGIASHRMENIGNADCQLIHVDMK
jgi:hypothetical protein